MATFNEECDLVKRTSAAASVPAAHTTRVPWSVDRWGRLLAGSGVLLTTGLGIFIHPLWLAVTVLAALNLVVTALSGSCPLNVLLIRMGAKEREDLFLPGGIPRRPGIKTSAQKSTTPKDPDPQRPSSRAGPLVRDEVPQRSDSMNTCREGEATWLPS